MGQHINNWEEFIAKKGKKTEGILGYKQKGRLVFNKAKPERFEMSKMRDTKGIRRYQKKIML